jgi:hypothetical protein
LRDELEDRMHLGVGRDDVAEGVALAQPVAKLAGLLNEPRLLDGPVDDGAERLRIERLEQVVLGPLLHRVDGARDRPECRHDHEHGSRRGHPGLLHEGDAVEPRHLEVRQDDVGDELVELSERLEAVGRRLGRKTVFAEDLAQRGARIRLVVDDEDPTALGHGGTLGRLRPVRETGMGRRLEGLLVTETTLPRRKKRSYLVTQRCVLVIQALKHEILGCG